MLDRMSHGRGRTLTVSKKPEIALIAVSAGRQEDTVVAKIRSSGSNIVVIAAGNWWGSPCD